MTKTIAAFGGRPIDLGGFRDHNPFRLFARERFRRFLRREGAAGEEEDSILLIAADLGPGQWFAEVAREEARPYRLVARPGADEKWSAHQRAKMAELAVWAEDVVESPEPEAFLSGGLLSAAVPGSRMAFVATDRARVGGRVAAEVRRLKEGGIPVFTVYPDEMTPPYLVLGALEDVRGAIPDGLLRTVEGAKLQLDVLIEGGNAPMRPKPLERARRRREELAVLETALRSLLYRDGEGC